MSAEKAEFTLPEWVKACLVLPPLAVIGVFLVPMLVTDTFNDLRATLTTDYSNHEVVEARVVSTETHGYPSNATHVWVNYEADGQVFDRVPVGNAEITTGENGGRVVELLVHPDDPSDVVTRGEVDGFYWHLGAALLMAALFAVLLACMVGLGVQELRKYRGAQRAAEAGETGEGPG